MDNEVIVIERLEAIKMVQSYREILMMYHNEGTFENNIALFLLAKDCAMQSVNKILTLHINKDDEQQRVYWETVKEYIDMT